MTAARPLDLAARIVQMVAGHRLLDNGIMVKDGLASERMARIDSARQPGRPARLRHAPRARA